MRALWLHYPDDAEAVKLGTEYLWGRDILVAPVVEKDATSRRLYLPRGRWFDFWTSERFEGGREMERTVDRSEEHTSELQSLTNLVCRLLLEKKKKLTQ